MKINYPYIKELCKGRSRSLSQILKESGVSRTAFYSLLKQDSLIPKSVHSIAEVLSVPVEDLINESPLKRTLRLQNRLQLILDRNPELSRENVWHTLILLEEPPINRLDRAIVRGRKFVYPKRS
jgi:transcriptional regulator with XRE-family HTH domain